MELRCRPLIELQVSLSSWIWHVELEYPNRHFNHYSKSSPALLSNCCPGVTLATHSLGLDPLRDIGCLKNLCPPPTTITHNSPKQMTCGSWKVQDSGSTVTVVGKDMTARRRYNGAHDSFRTTYVANMILW